MPTSTNWSVPWNPFHSFQIKYPLSRVLTGSLFLRFVLYLLYSVVQSSGSHFWRRSGSLHQAFPSLGNIRAFDHIGILEVRMLNKWVGNSEKIAWVAPTANPKKRLTCIYDSNQNENTSQKRLQQMFQSQFDLQGSDLERFKEPVLVQVFNIFQHHLTLAITCPYNETC